MDMLSTKYIKVSYFWPKSAKNLFVYEGCPKNWKKFKKIWEKFWFFFLHKSQFSVSYMNCANICGHWVPPPVQSRVKLLSWLKKHSIFHNHLLVFHSPIAEPTSNISQFVTNHNQTTTWNLSIFRTFLTYIYAMNE